MTCNMTLRERIINHMLEEIPQNQSLNSNSRYRGYFYVPLEFPEGTIIGKGMKRRINNFNAKCEDKFNILNLNNLSDEDLFNAYGRFYRCYSRQM